MLRTYRAAASLPQAPLFELLPVCVLDVSPHNYGDALKRLGIVQVQYTLTIEFGPL